MPPVGLVPDAEWGVDLPESLLGLRLAGEMRPLAHRGADAMDPCDGDDRADIVQDKTADLVRIKPRHHHADDAAHGGAEPVQAVNAEVVQQRVDIGQVDGISITTGRLEPVAATTPR